jgi:hypothetical protein
MEQVEGHKYQLWVIQPETIFNAYTADLAPVLAAKEIVNHLAATEEFELPLILEQPEGQIISLDYDATVDLIAGIIRHYFNLEPPNDKTTFSFTE